MDLTITNKGTSTWSSWVLAFGFAGNQQVTSVTNGAPAKVDNLCRLAMSAGTLRCKRRHSFLELPGEL